MKDPRVYITRDSGWYGVDIWPVTGGIRKFHALYGGICYGGAWKAFRMVRKASARANSKAACKYISKAKCLNRYGFYPRVGTAWYWNGKKAVKEDLAFSN